MVLKFPGFFISFIPPFYIHIHRHWVIYLLIAEYLNTNYFTSSSSWLAVQIHQALFLLGVMLSSRSRA